MRHGYITNRNIWCVIVSVTCPLALIKWWAKDGICKARRDTPGGCPQSLGGTDLQSLFPLVTARICEPCEHNAL